ncbi:MAG: hypothetical protein P4L22_06255 [Candidatus Babeliales bacterium]|nr:hypothetical protein [Candidatus Babeliales bacterium]
MNTFDSLRSLSMSGLVLILLFTSSISYSAKIIFDLGEVLLHQRGIRSYSHIISIVGPLNIAKYYYNNKSLIAAYYRIFQFGDIVLKQDCRNAWFAGQITNQELIAIISENIYKEEYSSFFKNKSERNLIATGIYLLLPENILKITNLDQEGFKIVKKCAELGHELFILSNWDAVSIELIKNKFPELFNLFKPENVIISGHHKKAKPDLQAFKIVIKDNNPSDYYFIDDLQENIDAANSLGINGILHKDWKSTMKLLSHLF